MIDLKPWQKAWSLLDDREKRNAWITLGVIVLGALSSVLMVASIMPFLAVLAEPSRIRSTPALARTYDMFGFGSDYAFLIALGLASFMVILLSNGIQILKTWVVARYTVMRMHTLSLRLLMAYLRQPYTFFIDRHSGEMGTRILAEAGTAVQQFLRPAADLIASGLTALALLGFLLWVDTVIALAAFGLLGGIYGAVFALSRQTLNRLGKVRVEANAERFRFANEALAGIKDIKLLGREAAYAARYEAPSRRMAQAQVVAQVIAQVPQFALQAVAFGGIILLCLALMDPARLSAGAGTGLGEILPILGVFAFAGQRLTPELGKLYRAVATLPGGAAAVDVVYDDLVQKAGGGTFPGTAPQVIGLSQALTLDAVSYRYPRAEAPGLCNVSLTIEAGEKIGIVGSTGAGKTTLADVVLGLLAPTEGQLRTDGVAVTEENLRAWQQTVGYVPQDIFLIDASVSENIALGLTPAEIDHARVHEAARIAQLDAFIRNDLPQDYDTHVGERGVRLSGGQRQRIGIARALYHDADLIVFDEATSALDNLTEAEVMAAIDALPGDKTVLMIAHRLSTVRRCDRIVVLDRGQVVGCDTWDALMADNAAFQRIAKLGEAA